MDESQIKSVIQKQKEFFATGITRKVTFRKSQLKRLYKAITQAEDDIKAAIFKDFKKPPFESFLTEIGIILHELKFLIRKVDSLAKPKKVKTPLFAFPGSSYIYNEPYGVALIISPWNYPFQLSFSPLIGAIAAGNCCVLKLSPYTPAISGVIRRILEDTFLDEYITVVEGHRDVNQILLKQRFDFIFFTGSPQLGRVVMESAAKNLTPVVLELGGKSPCVICEDANLKIAARRILWGKMVNAGQTCVAPDYLLVSSSVKDELVKLILKELKLFYGENLKKSNDFSRIISNESFERLSGYLKEGNVLNPALPDKDDLFMPLVLLDNVRDNSKVMQDEIFGPVLPLITFDRDEEAVSYILKKEKPLAFYLFTTSKKRERFYLENVSSGGVCVNDTLLHTGNYNLPFGGVGYSGIGKYHGIFSFETFSNKKAVFKNSNLIDIKLRYPPYTKKKEKIAKLFF
ncbi:MAG: aldehyde dehydrogenase [Brevinematia bacterium]